jgi:N-acetylglucosaminyldiphosphoundecaprenol N-acetyl-beta-D-mannosaminyltransferase
MFHARVRTSSARALDSSEPSRQIAALPTTALPISKSRPSDLARPVYCVLGLPIDAVDLADVVRLIEEAAITKTRCFISTPNLDFLVQTLSDAEFRDSLLDSDLCTADGMPIVWIARLCGIPIRTRVSGADLLEALKGNYRQRRPLNVFLFGGKDDISAAAGRAINASSKMLRCVGTLNPGFGNVEQISRPEFLEAINSSGADFVVASLGSTKGQSWLLRNRTDLTVPVRAHLGAALAFSAGAIRRAPTVWRKVGLEWLWRIKEEPYLWRRYAHDASVLLRLLVLNVLPIAILNRLRGLTSRRVRPFEVKTSFEGDAAIVRISGPATEQHVAKTNETLEQLLSRGTSTVCLELARVHWIDARFLGLILMLRKALNEQGGRLTLRGASPKLARLFRLHRVAFLLQS